MQYGYKLLLKNKCYSSSLAVKGAIYYIWYHIPKIETNPETDAQNRKTALDVCARINSLPEEFAALCYNSLVNPVAGYVDKIIAGEKDINTLANYLYSYCPINGPLYNKLIAAGVSESQLNAYLSWPAVIVSLFQTDKTPGTAARFLVSGEKAMKQYLHLQKYANMLLA